MKDLKEFIEKFVKIEYLDHCKSYGLYPFQMFVEDKEGKNNIVSLNLGGEIEKVYHAFMDYYKDSPKRIYMAVDFPAGIDMKNDFVCVFVYELDVLTVYAIPYKIKTGKVLPEIYESELLSMIKKDINLFIKQL